MSSLEVKFAALEFNAAVSVLLAVLRRVLFESSFLSGTTEVTGTKIVDVEADLLLLVARGWVRSTPLVASMS